jgi:hypothetical protein
MARIALKHIEHLLESGAITLEDTPQEGFCLTVEGYCYPEDFYDEGSSFSDVYRTSTTRAAASAMSTSARA